MSVFIVGAGSLGRVLFDFVTPHNTVKAFIDDDPNLKGKYICNLPVLNLQDIKYKDNYSFLLAILNPKGRESLATRIVAQGLNLINYFSESCFVSPSSNIGSGTILLPYSFIMNQAKVGNFVHIHFNSVIGHDVTVGDFSSLAPQSIIGGYSKIGKSVSIGMNVSILPNITIGDNSVIGAGSVVTKDIPANVTAGGNPSKILKHNK